MVMGTPDEAKDEAAILYKTKVVQFLGRSVPIILQNDNGPCPLLAICNVLLLRNNVNLSLDMTEISLQRLLSLVAERLLDANSNTENKNEEYVRNQQQNIADAIELLPRLATGLDVNVRFRNIHDFEFTPECAVFDLLDIGLVHGWLCDPQDEVTSKIIGANSYNTLVEKLVELQTSRGQSLAAASSEEDFVDFAAATTATLGVPSPSLESFSRTKSMEDLEIPKLVEKPGRKGDEEEAAQLQQILELSKDETLSGTNTVSPSNHPGTSASYNKGVGLEDDFRVMELSNSLDYFGSDVDEVVMHQVEELPELESSGSVAATHASVSLSDDPGGSCSLQTQDQYEDNVADVNVIQVNPYSPGCGKSIGHANSSLELMNSMPVCMQEDLQGREDEDLLDDVNFVIAAKINQESCKIDNSEGTSPLSGNVHVYDEELVAYPSEGETESLGSETPLFPKRSGVTAEEVRVALKEHENIEREGTVFDKESFFVENDDASYNNDIDETGSSSLQSSEPLYEGEAVLVEAETSGFENREPLYEGEVGLAEHTDAGELVKAKICTSQSSFGDPKSEIQEELLSVAVTEGMTIDNFLNSNASQLTYYGLFSLQEELKERELCVFFRNNHFNTMFKYNGDLYLLVTDQGYFNQPDVVWEKLHEVHGDSVFVTGNFLIFQADESSNIWNEQEAVVATADYLSSQKRSDQPDIKDTSYQSDLQLAMALQQQEFEQRQRQQQQQQQQQQRSHSPASPHSAVHSSRVPGRAETGCLVTGPKNSSVPPKQETKAKEKCVIM